ncbi:MAG: metalloregulator ArsR/SmtB family transcription factor [Paraburkholderia sp.]|uniref:ArsR/SmtB family transcription factor n=1 Tax=Paraburkholderia sp. TaxID=1926495 RepID=UPI00397B5327
MTERPAKLSSLMSKAVETAETLRLLAHANRLLLLCRIAQGECAVGQLEADLDIQQPALSQQLAELRKAGLVRTRRESRSIFYSIADARTMALLEMLCAATRGEVRPSPAAPIPRTRATAEASPPAGDAARFARVG